MGSYSLRITRSAAKEIASLPTRKDRRRVVERIASLADDPRPHGCQRLSGEDKYRIRVGRFRILYRIEDAVLVVTVVRVADRKEAYRYRARSTRAGILEATRRRSKEQVARGRHRVRDLRAGATVSLDAARRLFWGAP